MNKRKTGTFYQARGELIGLVTALDQMTDNSDCLNNPDVPAIRSVILTMEDAVIEAFDKLEAAFGVPALSDDGDADERPSTPMTEKSVLF